MLDIKHLRTDPKTCEKRLQSKEPDVTLQSLIAMDEKVRALKAEVEDLKAQRNAKSKEIGLKKRSGEDTSGIMAEVASFGEKIAEIDHDLKATDHELQETLARLPNMPRDGVPLGPDASHNVCIKTFGKKPHFDFEPKHHLEIAEHNDLLDMERGAKLSGRGWPVYKGLGARLEWALINYMIDIHHKNGFEMWMVPHLVRPEIMRGVGQLPKFEDQLFKVKDDDYQLYLIPTAEAALNGLHYDEILHEDELPLKKMAYTPCFRREAGAAGASERGLIRVHQFNKVEMFITAKPEQSDELFEQMILSAEEVLEGLGVHYRSMLLATGDMPFSAEKTIDVEVWLPGQDRYYEVSSISHCGDFQARRSKTRYKTKDGNHLVHTLNGSGVATSRLLVAILENNQNPDGTITLPKVLSKYLA